MTYLRTENRAADALRPVRITRQFTIHAEGSVLIEFGQTRVLCTASVEDRVPPHKKGSGEGWVTAEYGMLPRATHTRGDREAARGKQSGRTQEIQRLIGRSMRAVFDLKKLGERTIHLDCDVLQADGGTRTASICGAYIALHDALTRVQQSGLITKHPLHSLCAAVSVGIHNGVPIIDLPYVEDRNEPLLRCDLRSNTYGRIVMGPRTTATGRERNDLRDNHTVQQTSRGGSGA